MSDDNKSPATKLVLGATKGKLVRLAAVHLFKPKTNKDSGKEEYKVMVMIPKGVNDEDIGAARAAFEEQKKFFLEETKKKAPGVEFWNPIRDADADRPDGEEWSDEFKGHWIINAKTAAFDDEGQPRDLPDVVGTMKDEKGKLEPLGPKDIKSGDWGRVSVNFKYFTKKAGGVSAWLNRVQKVKAGEAMSNRGSAEDDFGSFDDAEEDDPLLS